MSGYKQACPYIASATLWLTGCAHLPQHPETTRLCIDAYECRDFPAEDAEFLVDYVCEDAPQFSAAVLELERALSREKWDNARD